MPLPPNMAMIFGVASTTRCYSCSRDKRGLPVLFVVETSQGKAARKWSWLMAVLLVLLSPYVFFTMRFYIKPSPPIPPGFRIFGFPRPRRDA
jgi:hypothetical protein